MFSAAVGAGVCTEGACVGDGMGDGVGEGVSIGSFSVWTAPQTVHVYSASPVSVSVGSITVRKVSEKVCAGKV